MSSSPLSSSFAPWKSSATKENCLTSFFLIISFADLLSKWAALPFEII